MVYLQNNGLILEKRLLSLEEYSKLMEERKLNDLSVTS